MVATAGRAKKVIIIAAVFVLTFATDMTADETTIGRWCDRMVPNMPKHNQTMAIVITDGAKVMLKSSFGQLARVLGDLATTLKPRGVLFCSNPRGDNEEGWAGGRYGCFHDLETWRAYVAAAGFLELHHYYRPPGRPREQQPWLATVWRKSSVNQAQ